MAGSGRSRIRAGYFILIIYILTRRLSRCRGRRRCTCSRFARHFGPLRKGYLFPFMILKKRNLFFFRAFLYPVRVIEHFTQKPLEYHGTNSKTSHISCIRKPIDILKLLVYNISESLRLSIDFWRPQAVPPRVFNARTASACQHHGTVRADTAIYLHSKIL